MYILCSILYGLWEHPRNYYNYGRPSNFNNKTHDIARAAVPIIRTTATAVMMYKNVSRIHIATDRMYNICSFGSRELLPSRRRTNVRVHHASRSTTRKRFQITRSIIIPVYNVYTEYDNIVWGENGSSMVYKWPASTRAR